MNFSFFYALFAESSIDTFYMVYKPKLPLFSFWAYHWGIILSDKGLMWSNIDLMVIFSTVNKGKIVQIVMKAPNLV